MNLKQVYASLSAAYQFWSPHTINQNFVVRQFGDFVELTWNQRSSELISEIPTEDALAEMVNRRQFSFQFEGGAAVRVHYRFDRRGKEIVSASLGYFSLIDTREEVDTPTWPSSDRGVELQDSSGKLRQISIEAAYDAESPHNSTTVRDGNTSSKMSNEDRTALLALINEYDIAVTAGGYSRLVGYMRIDYAPDQGRGVLHHDCHLHLSSFPYSRLVVSRLPSPWQFIELVVAINNPDVYRNKRLTPEGKYRNETEIRHVNSPCFASTPIDDVGHIAHLVFPGMLS